MKQSRGYWRELLRGDANAYGNSINQTHNRGLEESYVDSKDSTQRFGVPKKFNILFPAERPAKHDAWHYLDKNCDPVV
ncbi:hypothetical protein Forpe1208_v015827 [Fusarium oxysporum f. sp. rapae]|uniref:Uncharacterized protein n=1 Tax=Fusarium oxysporum f. sp. rapae TaxID=485398 RepID=A0A8J5TN05_FUSOX|nr:hypothetical protein Forpe1208_v015827 [Fusarium oxysporum f. sp. rapae]